MDFVQHHVRKSYNKNKSALMHGIKKPTSTKRSWSGDEDMKLKHLVSMHGTAKWSTVADALGGRSGKQCRERWHNHLNPDVKKGDWTVEVSFCHSIFCHSNVLFC